jgi:hypothetical protein
MDFLQPVDPEYSPSWIESFPGYIHAANAASNHRESQAAVPGEVSAGC